MGAILGLGVTHYPPLCGRDEDMARILKRVLQDPGLPEQYRQPAFLKAYSSFREGKVVCEWESGSKDDVAKAYSTLGFPYDEIIISWFDRFLCDDSDAWQPMPKVQVFLMGACTWLAARRSTRMPCSWQWAM